MRQDVIDAYKASMEPLLQEKRVGGPELRVGSALGIGAHACAHLWVCASWSGCGYVRVCMCVREQVGVGVGMRPSFVSSAARHCFLCALCCITLSPLCPLLHHETQFRIEAAAACRS